MDLQKIVVYGAGAFAREVAWLVQMCNETVERYEIACFVDDTPEQQGTTLDDIPVMGLEEAHRRFLSARVVAALGNPKNRELVVKKAEEKGFSFETIIHPRTEMSRKVDIGLGTVICAGCILSIDVKLGRHVQINLDCTIGHNASLGDFTTVSPGVHVSGWVHIGKRVFVGTGAVIINGTAKAPLIVEDDVVIGAGSCVIGSLPANQTYAGVPARQITMR